MAQNIIASVAIYPPLGIARVGNSDEYYLASDLPGKAPVSADGYKDARGRIKKQAACFRIYALDDQGGVLHEVTATEGNVIEWRVNLANRKAGWYNFENAMDLPEGQPKNANLRNAKYNGALRTQLNIVPTAQTIKGAGQPGKLFNDGKFFGKAVPLGEILTDEHGHLLVLGGDGTSASPDNLPAYTFANNDGWHDDVADGTIYASVTIGGETFEATPAMVAITPPNYGQGLFAVVTMYDVVEDLYIRNAWMPKPEQVVFWEHIYPILERTVQTQWVNHGFYILFGQNSPSDFTNTEVLAQLSQPAPANKDARMRVFQWYRDPSGTAYEPIKIPPFYGDAFGDYSEVHNVDLPLTATQYERMKQWAEGTFVTGSKPADIPFDQLSPLLQTKALERAPLEECLGGPFHPGIELTWPLRNLIFWKTPFRVKLLKEGEEPGDYGSTLTPAVALGVGGPLDGSGAGSLTRWMGVPWQTDEASCLSGYDPTTYLSLPSFWAARVPNQVLSADAFNRLSDATTNLPQRLKHFDYRQDWLRDLGTNYVGKINKMIRNWHALGIATEHPLPEGSSNVALPATLWVESGRGDFTTVDPSFEQVKIAEYASVPFLRKTEALLEMISGVKADQQALKVRKPFSRDER
jgi:hypothetical protein